MKEKSQRELFDFLQKNGIENFVGIPDSTMKYFIDQAKKKHKLIITTREEEAIGITVGMTLAKSPSVVFMQNAGFANSISTITSLVQLYKIPIIFIIGWRGFQSIDAPEHVKLGKIQPDLLKILKLNSKVINDVNWKKCSKWAISQIDKKNSCALIIRREFID